jgi:cell division protein FtsX
MLALGRARRRDETRLLLSLGFTRFSAFLPAALSGLLAAVAGATLGLGILRVGWSVSRRVAAPAPIDWRFLSPAECALGLAVALAVGALGGYFTARVSDPVDGR